MTYYSVFILFVIRLLLIAFFQLLAPIVLPFLIIYVIYRLLVPRKRTTYTSFYEQEDDPYEDTTSSNPPKHNAIDVEYTESDVEDDSHDS